MHWTFGQKIAAGLAVILALTVLMGLVSGLSLRHVVAEKDRVITGYTADMLTLQRLVAGTSEQMAHTRGYLLTGSEEQLREMREGREARMSDWSALVGRLPAEANRFAERIEAARGSYWAAADRVISARRGGMALDAVARRFDAEVVPAATGLRQAIDALAEHQETRMQAAMRQSNEAASQAMALMVALSVLAVLIGAAVAVSLTRMLSRQIGEAVNHLQSSSTELQAAASQQAAGSGEQSAAMGEVSTTMKELLSTSRQIASSAQRVAAIAEATAASAALGDTAVTRALASTQTIKAQVDRIVQHMLDLGRRTQQIGAVLEIIKELAEQTNILSINATIEAAGAGEHGRRFAAVAEEIRKLADRVGDSTGEVRQLIEEVREAANTTVMSTEEGAKAVEAGTREFGELASAFTGIVDQVGTTAEAAREIELSTKQQATAVEQVNLAIADAAQAAKETEASSRATMQTSSQLATVSRELARLVKAEARA